MYWLFYSVFCCMNTMRDYTQIGSFDDMVWNIAALSPAMMHTFLFSSHQIWFVSTLLTHCLIKGIYNDLQTSKSNIFILTFPSSYDSKSQLYWAFLKRYLFIQILLFCPFGVFLFLFWASHHSRSSSERPEICHRPKWYGSDLQDLKDQAHWVLKTFHDLDPR